MKNTARFSARRVMQAGATFAALGALTVATAVPVNADQYRYTWAYADIAGGYGWTNTGVVDNAPSSRSNAFSGAVGDYLTIDAETSAHADLNGATATTVVNSARIQFTVGDLEGVLDDSEEEDGEDATGEDDGETGEPSEAPSDAPSEGETDTDGSEGEGSEGDGEAPSPSPTPESNEGSDESEPGDGSSEESAPEAEQTQEPEAAGAGGENEVVTLDETNSELTDGGDEVVLDVTITDVTITTTQTWGGEVTHSVVPGTVTENVNSVDASVSVTSEEDFWEVDSSQEEDLLWHDAYTAGVLNISVPEYFVVTYPLGETMASVAEVVVDDGDGNGGDNTDTDDGQDGSGEEGDDKNPPTERDVPESKPDPRSVEPLAQTGSPVVGLIAAGAAVAAGGGLAAFFARRRKTAAAADESSEG
ncbi:LPXTG cell wall anchor domain-containing protein [Nocardiopsis sp. EMB25]|uniref:LPXTG cell wall anchor domain-containing protein n=1 Tax=Nocardiopsis sp. EMB25 TaxID=2835867 RepID=UPI002284F899|nr:LPXTG cell wall anchor domain-containing protein [Nocardiopsis sp. EMB25]MCY9786201.1 LPXTG cell wall anchor domain-containing protein [Nocardiopsis sp. EMB25]